MKKLREHLSFSNRLSFLERQRRLRRTSDWLA
jgi:hypothetical protein